MVVGDILCVYFLFEYIYGVSDDYFGYIIEWLLI